MTRKAIRSDIRDNLNDAGITYYSDSDINDAIQDAYNEIVSRTFCFVKSLDVDWDSKIYWDFINDADATDYMGTVAIFNTNTNLWLRDDLSLRDFDRIRKNWETWIGAPQFWAPHSLKYVAIAPYYTSPSGTFKLVYWALPPTLAGDSDSPLIATDMQSLFEYYCTADLLETAQEITKATIYWAKYEKDIPKYKARCINMAKTDLLLRV
ncbi:MAG: hypothetical protein ACREHG_06825 [Candidatus Saccharimonadales bacterium]